MVSRRHLRFFAAVLAAGLALVASAAEPLLFGSIETTSPAGPVRGWWAKVHLDNPAVHAGVTEPLVVTAADPAGTEAKLIPVNEWAAAHGATLAVNANFFGLLKPSKPAPGLEDNVHYTTGVAADIRGLSLNDRHVVSPPRVMQDRGDPALLILAGRARIAYARDADLEGVLCAVAGIGPDDKHKEPGTLLVEAGRNTGATARVGAKIRHPRTAVGVSADGRTLIILAIDGRQPAHSVGVTLPELADLMIDLSAHDALNLDGGGSTSFYLRRADGSLVTNQPSDGHWRPVANHLGIWIDWPKPPAAK
ncbi:MAG: phosphodiester glycosidase family protein [bacterium]|nr:phosphodiester glycosidase family protein [bacterium]MDI1335221.1 phosphodiester glycosidase family protein [Lacunisphaera sp.]